MNYKILGIEHIQLAAPQGCEVAARKFFGDILGMEEIPKPESLQGRGGVWFKVGNQELHIGVEQNFSPAKKAHPAFTIVELKQLQARLEECGVAIKEDTPIAGRSRFFVSDPFGNRIEFLEFHK
ncbi:VOC family protein [Peribacillus alkalitolerans]|uniref:VOC family protein n=1 Tax=Peribacillus alkalitolerans TaxID=1550385 RepID=UPI0013CF8132|nr:VOC family protein [Peribacillus alkalitolerans]